MRDTPLAPPIPQPLPQPLVQQLAPSQQVTVNTINQTTRLGQASEQLARQNEPLG